MSEQMNEFDDTLVIHVGEHVVAFFSPSPVVTGHTVVMPKAAFPILEEVPEHVLSEVAITANKISMLLFEKLQVQGTNLLIQNGPAAGQQHRSFSLHIIPRKEGDDVALSWENTSPDPKELTRVLEQLVAQGTRAVTLPSPKQVEVSEPDIEEIGEDTALAEQLKRTP